MPNSLPPAFADMMLGRLATWLRLIGADVAYRNRIEDDELLRVAAAEGRLVLTRDRGIAEKSAQVRCFLVQHDHLADQLRHVSSTFDLTRFRPFSRCVRCNVPLIAVDKESVKGRLWPYVYRTQEHIRQCPCCRRLFWGGTHRDRALGDLARMLGSQFAERLTGQASA